MVWRLRMFDLHVRCSHAVRHTVCGLVAAQTLRKAYFLPPEDTVEQRSIQVLAMFSNPRALPQLSLMRELIHLQHAIQRKAVLPAARCETRPHPTSPQTSRTLCQGVDGSLVCMPCTMWLHGVATPDVCVMYVVGFHMMCEQR